MAPTIALTMPLRMRPAPRAVRQPRTTPSQLVPLPSSGEAYPEARAAIRLALPARFLDPAGTRVRAVVGAHLVLVHLGCVGVAFPAVPLAHCYAHYYFAPLYSVDRIEL